MVMLKKKVANTTRRLLYRGRILSLFSCYDLIMYYHPDSPPIDMEFDLPRACGTLVAIIAIGAGGLVASGVTATQTVLMMVLPSMVIFAAVAFWLGMKYGEYRALQ
jgi:hypothetical protein